MKGKNSNTKRLKKITKNEDKLKDITNKENFNEKNNRISNENLQQKIFDKEKIENLKNEIFEDTKKINNLNILIQDFLKIYSAESENSKKIFKKDKEYIYYTIKEIFEYFLRTKKNNLSLYLKKFLSEKLNLFLNILIDLIDPEESCNRLEILINKPFEIYELLYFEFSLLDNDKYLFSNTRNSENKNEQEKKQNILYEQIIEKLILNFELIEADNIKLLSERLINNLDLSHLYNILSILSEKINFSDKDELTKINLEKIDNTDLTEKSDIQKNYNFMFFNLYNFIISLPKFSDLNKNKNPSENKKIFLLENKDFLNQINSSFENNLNSSKIAEKVESDSNENNLSVFQNYLKRFYEIIITKIVNSYIVPNEIISNLLINLNKIILDNLENPLIFSDFLINIYEKSKEKDFAMKVLSLSGLFILITKYKLDYQNYYNMLYQSLCLSHYDGKKLNFIFDAKYKNRIFKIFEISLKPSSVPILVILSFVKKLARMCLYNTPSNIAIIMGLILNILKNHPKSLLLLIRKRKSYDIGKLQTESKFLSAKRQRSNTNKINEENDNETDYDKNLMNNLEKLEKELPLNEENINSENFCKYDQFIDDELDPYKTNAQNSCLWELYSLRNHYNFKIRSLVNKFEKNFLKSKEFDISSISDLKNDDLLNEMNDKANFYFNNQTNHEEIINFIGKKIDNLI